MKIKHIHIENFGTLSKIDIHLKDNANFLLRDNAWGKTTLAVFIKVMFYGFDHENKNDEALNERRRYLPWQGGVYGGSIVFAVRNKEYRLSKTFGKKKNEDRVAIYDAGTNLVTTDYTTEPGMELFGIDKDSFLRTIYVSGHGSELAVTSGIQAKLSDISVLDGDIHKYDRVRERIKKEKDYLNPNRKTGEIQKRYRDLSMLKAGLDRKDLDEKRLFELKEEIVDLEFQREEILAKLGDLHSESSVDLHPENPVGLQEDIPKPAASEDVALKPVSLHAFEPLEFLLTLRDEILDLLEEKIGNTEEFIKDYIVLFIIVYVGYLLSHIIWGDGIFTLTSLFVMFLLSIFITFVLYIILRLTVYRKIDPAKYGMKRDENTELQTIETNAWNENEVQGEAASLQSRDEEDAEDYKPAEKEEWRLHLENTLLQDEKQILERLLVLRQEKIELSEKVNENIWKQKEFFEKRKEYRALKERYEILISTEFFLEKARISYTSKYMEPLKNAFDKYFSMFTKSVGSYRLADTGAKSPPKVDVGNLVMDANLDIHIDSNGVLHSTKILSDGYRDVVGLCKRFALMDIMYKKERPPVILDDPFINLDDGKINGAMQFLMDLSKEGQVLYFTCTRSRFPKR